ncbi:hypothetical protein MJ904_24960 [Massilia sp. MB5]|uniref:hypothetical protein n=1 Tax=Massilia sp. MB5 TaxID=2919578 RepID=UPI001F0F2A03|nr:hypothetical protein [Massilia sp. MB5]UMR30206.1 hypothetical protein MJ904_24960 [Massilia sp. MB5]
MTLRSKSSMRVGALLFFFFALLAMRFSYAEEKPALPVSIYQLMANPEKYDGKEVYVIGFMHMEFEGDVLYAHREDWVHTLIQNGVALDVPKSEYSKWIKINNNYVVVQGFFSATERGHLSLRAGSLTKITKLIKWQGPKR